MKPLKAMSLTLLLGTNLFLNACKKHEVQGGDPPEGPFTHYIDYLEINKVNYSDSLLVSANTKKGVTRIDFNITHADPNNYLGSHEYSPIPERLINNPVAGGDTILSLSGDNFISPGNLPIKQTDSTDTFLMEKQQRLEVIDDHRLSRSQTRVFKPWDNASIILIKWRNNDIAGKHDPLKSWELANKAMRHLKDRNWEPGL